MGVAYAEVEYEVQNRKYRTIHGLYSDATGPFNTFGLQDYVNWGGDLIGDADFAGATDPADSTVDPRSLIEAILYFHRYMQSPAVILRNLSINDGPTPGTSTGNFVSVNLDLQCRGNPTVNIASLGGLNNTMMITKQPQGFSQRKGRMFLRGAICNSHMVAGGDDGVTFVPGFRSAYALELAEGAIGAGVGVTTRLFSYMGSGKLGLAGTDVAYVIPKTTKVIGPDPETGQPTEKRYLSGFAHIANLDVSDVQDRNTRRRQPKK